MRIKFVDSRVEEVQSVDFTHYYKDEHGKRVDEGIAIGITRFGEDPEYVGYVNLNWFLDVSCALAYGEMVTDVLMVRGGYDLGKDCDEGKIVLY